MPNMEKLINIVNGARKWNERAVELLVRISNYSEVDNLLIKTKIKLKDNSNKQISLSKLE